MNKFFCTISGLRSISRAEKGRILLYLVAFVPMIYKLISPFFIIIGMASYTVGIIPAMVILGIIMAWGNLRKSIRGLHIFLLVQFFNQELYCSLMKIFGRSFLLFFLLFLLDC